MTDTLHATTAFRMLNPPTPEQVETYDVCEEDGDLFHVSDVAHVQCQLQGTELWVHNIEIQEHARRTGVARRVLRAIQEEHPGIPLIANGVEWESDAGSFWRAMVEEGVVERVVTYQHGEITATDLGASTPSR